MSYQREVENALNRMGFTYLGSDLETSIGDSFQIWETPDGKEKFKIILDGYDEDEEEDE
jgi:hypothetical protein